MARFTQTETQKKYYSSKSNRMRINGHGHGTEGETGLHYVNTNKARS